MKTGGPAFPVDPEAHKLSDLEYQALSGMSLRDYFAAKAMQAIVSMPSGVIKAADSHGHHVADISAISAYVIADAMIKAMGN